MTRRRHILGFVSLAVGAFYIAVVGESCIGLYAIGFATAVWLAPIIIGDWP